MRSGGDGGTPFQGWTGEQDWIGVVPPDRLPAVLDPPGGQIVTANAEIDRSWPGVLTRDWTAPFRAMRIAERLRRESVLTRRRCGTSRWTCGRRQPIPSLAAVETAPKSPQFAKADATPASASSGCGCGIDRWTAVRS